MGPDPDSNGSLDTRDIIVPLSLYKIVIVFSTLIAIASVVIGFLLLDAATRRATAPASEVDPVVTLLGLGAIAVGAVVYAFATRFQAPGMRKPKETDDESPHDG